MSQRFLEQIAPVLSQSTRYSANPHALFLSNPLILAQQFRHHHGDPASTTDQFDSAVMVLYSLAANTGTAATTGHHSIVGLSTATTSPSPIELVMELLL